ncbi:MAG: aldo/keto reductase family protein [Candidatus Berkiella sp.]
MLSSFSSQSPTSTPDKDLPLMGLGTFIGIEADRIADHEARQKVTTDTIYCALAEGYRHLDLAENYGNLPAVAAALKKAFLPKSEGGLGLKREEIWLTMKSDGFTERNVNALLKVVGVKYFDLFLIHHPQSAGFASENSLKKCWHELASIDKSKVKRIGVSNFYEPHLERLLAICERESLEKPYANEIELNILCKNKVTVDYCQKAGIKVIAYSPLGYANVSLLLANEELNALAKKMGATPAQAALAWMMEKGIAVIPKTTKVERLAENLQSTRFIDSVKSHHHERAAIDAQDDVVSDGLSQTAVDAKEHAERIDWDPTAKKNTQGFG